MQPNLSKLCLPETKAATLCIRLHVAHRGELVLLPIETYWTFVGYLVRTKRSTRRCYTIHGIHQQSNVKMQRDATDTGFIYGGRLFMHIYMSWRISSASLHVRVRAHMLVYAHPNNVLMAAVTEDGFAYAHTSNVRVHTPYTNTSLRFPRHSRD